VEKRIVSAIQIEQPPKEQHAFSTAGNPKPKLKHDQLTNFLMNNPWVSLI
jgi:hypothetical protein